MREKEREREGVRKTRKLTPSRLCLSCRRLAVASVVCADGRSALVHGDVCLLGRRSLQRRCRVDGDENGITRSRREGLKRTVFVVVYWMVSWMKSQPGGGAFDTWCGGRQRTRGTESNRTTAVVPRLFARWSIEK